MRHLEILEATKKKDEEIVKPTTQLLEEVSKYVLLFPFRPNKLEKIRTFL